MSVTLVLHRVPGTEQVLGARALLLLLLDVPAVPVLAWPVSSLHAAGVLRLKPGTQLD